MCYGKGMLSMSNGLYSQIVDYSAMARDLLDQINDVIRKQVESIDYP